MINHIRDISCCVTRGVSQVWINILTISTMSCGHDWPVWCRWTLPVWETMIPWGETVILHQNNYKPSLTGENQWTWDLTSSHEDMLSSVQLLLVSTRHSHTNRWTGKLVNQSEEILTGQSELKYLKSSDKSQLSIIMNLTNQSSVL